ncbi:hypothetical protein [Tenggerimyces flavus]|uniref:Uncharacterized protein n=1 Tax=Tenggerimyces flavus TaxID=1708749 RepID=A0ABV7YFZ7_9ACTN|nr:hypothetical protein [Tenggerimyces flavus]MBM7784300.1 hypothetical protein [Tenggerimyces flavus]
MRSQLLKTGLVAVAIAGGLWVLTSALFRVKIPFVLLLALVLAVVGSRAVLLGLRSPMKQALLIREDSDPPILGLLPDRPFAGARRWEYLLDGAREEPALFAKTVRPELVRLMDERLRLAHRIDRTKDPERARAVIGPVLADLWERERTLTRAEIDNVLDEMEKLWATPR